MESFSHVELKKKLKTHKTNSNLIYPEMLPIFVLATSVVMAANTNAPSASPTSAKLVAACLKGSGKCFPHEQCFTNADCFNGRWPCVNGQCLSQPQIGAQVSYETRKKN